MRDKLIELVAAAKNAYYDYSYEKYEKGLPVEKSEVYVADHLLANGVVELLCNAKGAMPPCNVGDTVYRVEILFGEVMISELKVVELTLDNKGIKTLHGMTKQGSFYCFNRGYNLNDIRFTKEAAEQALKNGMKPGRWIEREDCVYQCSECGFQFTTADDISKFKFCRCGANMKGETPDKYINNTLPKED